MSAARHLLPLYAFMAWTGSFTFLIISGFFIWSSEEHASFLKADA
jgi:hypothetical protein